MSGTSKNLPTLVTIGHSGHSGHKNYSGHVVIPYPSTLTRLHYFDGKFLRAQDMELEQRYLRELGMLSNQGGGAGVVHGLSCTLGSGDQLQVSAGLAIDARGRILHLPQAAQAEITALIEASQRHRLRAEGLGRSEEIGFTECEQADEAEPAEPAWGGELYLITIGHAEASCGEEDVYGKLCEEACVTSTERPYIVEGVVIRAIPISLVLATSELFTQIHLRSLVASAYFEQERQRHPDLISRQGLNEGPWCLGAGLPHLRTDVPIALLARSGTTTLFLDAWIARRERMEAPPRQYWSWRLAMRPWSVFLAQLLHFQCQLRDAFRDAATPGGDDDPCAGVRGVARDAGLAVRRLVQYYAQASQLLAAPGLTLAGADELPKIREGVAGMQVLLDRLEQAGTPELVAFPDRFLLRAGITELPPAGYLPVVPSATLPINTQVRRLLGPGVDLRFCVVRPDFVPHALEEAQHMERISLVTGLDDPAARPKVDVLVPNGLIKERQSIAEGSGYEINLALGDKAVGLLHEVLLPTPRELVKPAKAMAEMAEILEMPEMSEMSEMPGIAATVPVPGAAPGQQIDPASTNQLYGAARIVSDHGSGHELHLAARPRPVPEYQLRQPAPVTRTPVSPATPAPATPDTATTSATVADELLDQSLIDTVVLPLPVTSPPPVIKPITPIPTRVTALWVSLRSDQDPFQLQVNQATRITARITLIVDYEREHQGKQQLIRTLADTRLGGELVVEEVHRGAEAGASVRAVLQASGVREERRTGAGSQLLPLSLHHSLTLDRRVDRHGGSRTVITMPGSIERTGQQLRFELRLVCISDPQGSPLAEAMVCFEQPINDKLPKELLFFTTRLRADDAALAPGHAAHQASIGALRSLDELIAQPGFLTAAEQALFQIRRPSIEQLVVLGREDWVLFHRRRDKHCRGDITPQPEVQPRRYQVFHVRIIDAEMLEALQQALAAGDITQLEPKAFTQVEHGAGVQTIISPHPALRDDWHDQGVAGHSIVLGAVASRGAAAQEGPDLAEARLSALTRVLAPVTPTDPAAPLLALDHAPAPLRPGELDGVMLLATMEAAEQECHTAYWLDPTPLPEIDQLLDKGDLAGLLGNEWAALLSQVDFAPGTDHVTAGVDQLTTKWQELSGDCLPQTLHNLAANPDDPAAARAKEMAMKLGAADVEVLAVPTTQITGDCQVATLLRAAVTCHRVWRVQPKSGDDLKQIDQAIETSNLNVLKEHGLDDDQGQALFCAGTTTLLSTDLDSLGAGTVVRLLVWRNPDAPDQETDDTVLTQQAVTIATTLGIPTSIHPEVMTNDGPWPATCPHVTMLLLQRSG